MVSNAKRMRYVSENESSSSSDGEAFEDYPRNSKRNSTSERTSKRKWLSKNAIMARENRLKKKLYISNLEKEVGHLKSENTNFTKVIDNQSLLIADLKKEVKYLKSVIANSTDIGNLIKNIHYNTGMSVSTSLDQTLSLNDYLSKPKQPIARKTAHPWEEKRYPSFPTPESDLSSPQNDFNDELLNTVDLDEFLGVSDNFVTPIILEEESNINDGLHLKEHNYTTVENESDVGVCLHVSKHRVSLEFCSSCSDNASHTWND